MLAAHRMDTLRTSVGPKMVALSSKNVFSKNVYWMSISSH